MTAIWRNDGSGWRLLAPTGFPAEEALHTLVEEAPHMLPLAGAPRLIVLGREVLLGNGSADLIAVEPSGRLVVIEVKLRRNSEARRAVVAQVLTYAAYLRGLDPSHLEQQVLRRHLDQRGYKSIGDAVAASDQEDSFDVDAFSSGLAESLGQGRFRLVVVLDEAPDELIELIGYLEAITDKLLIDLITVAAYSIDGSQILVPQRMDTEQQPRESRVSVTLPTPSTRPIAQSRSVEGADDFEAVISEAPEEAQPALKRLCDWARSLETAGLVKLSTVHGIAKRWTLRLWLLTENAGLVTVWNDSGAYIQFSRSVFERRAPKSLPHIEALIAPVRLGQGTTTRDITPELLEALTAAYHEAAAGRIGGE